MPCKQFRDAIDKIITKEQTCHLLECHNLSGHAAGVMLLHMLTEFAVLVEGHSAILANVDLRPALTECEFVRNTMHSGDVRFQGTALRERLVTHGTFERLHTCEEISNYIS